MKRKNFPRRKEARQDEAVLRQADRSHRTDAEQLALLDKRRGTSERERTRLLVKLGMADGLTPDLAEASASGQISERKKKHGKA